MKVGLDMDDTEPSTLYDQVCSNLSLWRGLKYTDNEQNVLESGDFFGAAPGPAVCGRREFRERGHISRLGDAAKGNMPFCAQRHGRRLHELPTRACS